MAFTVANVSYSTLRPTRSERLGDGGLPFERHPASVRDADTLNHERHTRRAIMGSFTRLEESACEGRLQKLKGLGAALQTKVLHGLALRRESHGKLICTERPSS